MVGQYQQHVINFTNFSQLDLSHLTNSLGIELSLLSRTCPPLLYSMLESAVCQESMHATQSTYLVIRRMLRTLALSHLESEICQSNAVLAAENLLGLSQLLTTELQEWNMVLPSLSNPSPHNNILSQRLLSWIMARFGEIQLPYLPVSDIQLNVVRHCCSNDLITSHGS
jgi:hypothetical protein